jgi:thymidylate synthase
MKLNELAIYAVDDLYVNGKAVVSEKLQAQKVENPMLEIINRFYQCEMPETKEELALLCLPDLPWSEDHFQERVCGEPLNPGKEYLNWPYYNKTQSDDNLFKSRGFFNHNYMERYWCDKNLIGTGKAQEHFGDLDDIIERIKNDRSGRQSYFSVWEPNDHANDSERKPCTLGYWFLVRDGKLHLTYHIRSCDIRRHFRNDLYMTIRLAQWVRDQVDKDMKLGIFSIWIGSLHCWEMEKEILRNDIRKLKK